MPNKKVLIAYATRYGTTAETAKDIGNFLQEWGIETTLVDLKHTKEKNWPQIDDFDGIIVASGIKIGRWMNEPQKFLNKNKEKLAAQTKILGVFVSCGTIVTDPEKAKTDYLIKKMESLGIKFQICEPFGPIYDFSATSQMGGFAKRVTKAGAKETFEPLGIQIDYNGRNDLRIPDQIRNFADQFAQLLES